jgi:hypothetical protein
MLGKLVTITLLAISSAALAQQQQCQFLTRAEADRWITEHQWLTKQNLKRLPDQPRTDPAKHND